MKFYPIFLVIVLFLVACEPVTLEEMGLGGEEELEDVLNELGLEEEIEIVKEEINEEVEPQQEEPQEIVVEVLQEPEEPQKEEAGVEPEPAHKSKTIIIENMELSASNIFIFPDTEVIWVNKDSLPHKISGPGFASGTMNQNQEFRHKFTKAGKYRYTDEFHQSIWGYVNVVDIASLGLNVKEPEELVWILIENYKFHPEIANIKAGQIVIWENRDPMAHTVKGPGFSSNALMGGKRFYHKFEQVGTYIYECTKHELESGRVIVN